MARGHTVLLSTREPGAGAELSLPDGMLVMQSPRAHVTRNPGQPVMGYADLLWAQGWSNKVQLSKGLQTWSDLYRQFQPDLVLLDHSPTARLAAHALQIPCVLIGTGFELPPAEDPLPLFPGYPTATPALAAQVDRQTLECVNAVLAAKGYRRLDSLSQLVQGDAAFLTTVPELDHYPTRKGGVYVGPLADPSRGIVVKWPLESRLRVFAYLRPTMPKLDSVMEGLRASGSSVIAYAPGIPSDLVHRFESPYFQFTSKPVQFDSVFPTADLCLSYGPAGTVAMSALRGVPQLIFPLHVESQLTAQRVENLGVGRSFSTAFTAADIKHAVDLIVTTVDYKLRARTLASRHHSLVAGNGVKTIISTVEELTRGALGCRRQLTDSGSVETARGACRPAIDRQACPAIDWHHT